MKILFDTGDPMAARQRASKCFVETDCGVCIAADRNTGKTEIFSTKDLFEFDEVTELISAFTYVRAFMAPQPVNEWKMHSDNCHDGIWRGAKD
jgi:hypothetical protein